MFAAAVRALEPRGPDATTIETMAVGESEEWRGIPLSDQEPCHVSIGFCRLHVRGGGPIKASEQPFHLKDGSRLVVNGEIFNATALIKEYGLPVPEGSSDCAVIPALLERGFTLKQVARLLDGDFAIVWVRPMATPSKANQLVVEAVRDPYGVRPLFYTNNCFASEIKGLLSLVPLLPKHLREDLFVVEPGTHVTWRSSTGGFRTERWHEVPWLKNPRLSFMDEAGHHLMDALNDAVRKRLSTVRGIGACLSGGLDSSLVASIAAWYLKMDGGGGGQGDSEASNVRTLHTYSIGMEGSPDLIASRKVAEHIGSIHHERIITPAECLSAIPAVIRAVESYDITTIRASVGNWLLGQFIAEVTPDVKVVLNGDGADEVLGGYLYMRNAPDPAAFENEIDRLLTEIHLYDVARSERCMAAHGLESRSPFLDRQFVSVARSVPTKLLMTAKDAPKGHEKRVLRHAYSCDSMTASRSEEGACMGSLPDEILWRPKEAFSDGISRPEDSWYKMAQEEGARRGEGAGAEGGSEASWYRQIFKEIFGPTTATTPKYWMPQWTPGATDPSARTLTELY